MKLLSTVPSARSNSKPCAISSGEMSRPLSIREGQWAAPPQNTLIYECPSFEQRIAQSIWFFCANSPEITFVATIFRSIVAWGIRQPSLASEELTAGGSSLKDSGNRKMIVGGSAIEEPPAKIRRPRQETSMQRTVRVIFFTPNVHANRRAPLLRASVLGVWLDRDGCVARNEDSSPR